MTYYGWMWYQVVYFKIHFQGIAIYPDIKSSVMFCFSCICTTLISYQHPLRSAALFLYVLAEVVTYESSAYISVWLLSTAKGRSFINNINNKGPIIYPCGTPVLIVNFADDLPMRTVHCDLPLR